MESLGWNDDTMIVQPMRMAYQDSSNNDVTWNFMRWTWANCIVLFALMSHFACVFAIVGQEILFLRGPKQ